MHKSFNKERFLLILQFNLKVLIIPDAEMGLGALTKRYRARKETKEFGLKLSLAWSLLK
jgi:hypothetical protein